MKAVAALGMTLMLTAGCVTVAPEEGAPAGTCESSRAQGLVGRAATVELGTEAMRLTGATRLRWIQPGDVITMDYVPSRLNVKLDAQNRVTAFTCG